MRAIVTVLGKDRVGIIASVYLLATKEHCAAYARKMTYALVPTRYVVCATKDCTSP